MRTLSLQANDISQRFGRPPRSAGSIGQPRERDSPHKRPVAGYLGLPAQHRIRYRTRSPLRQVLQCVEPSDGGCCGPEFAHPGAACLCAAGNLSADSSGRRPDRIIEVYQSCSGAKFTRRNSPGVLAELPVQL
jgi:hypothetical protein